MLIIGCDYHPSFQQIAFAQQRAVEDYVRQNERPTGELRWIADRRMAVFSSEALRRLFPSFRFVAIRWITEVDEPDSHNYSIPGPILKTLARIIHEFEDKRSLLCYKHVD